MMYAFRGVCGTRFWLPLLATALAAEAGAQSPAAIAGHPVADIRPDTSTTITTDEATSFAVIPSPQHDRLLLTIQGALWSVPFAGGKARALTNDFIEPVKIDWSPDGSRILMQSYGDGMFHLWTLRPDGKGLQQLTRGDYDDFDPAWSHSGTQVAFVSDRSGNRDLWVLDIHSGATKQLTHSAGPGRDPDVSAPATMMGVPSWVSDPTWSADDTQIAFVRDRTIEIIDVKTQSVHTLLKPSGFSVAGLRWSPDGYSISYALDGQLWVAPADGSAKARRVGNRDDVFPFPAHWLSNTTLLYSANGRIWTSELDGPSHEIPFSADLTLRRPAYKRKHYDFDDASAKPVKGISGPALSPDGREVVFKALNALWLLKIGEHAQRLSADGYYATDPAWAPSGRRIAYASDRAGTQDLYVRELDSGSEKRVTSSQDAEVAPAWSPDGLALAYETQTGDLRIVELSSGQVRTLATGLNMPGRPSWSPDGRTIVVAALHKAKNHILEVDVHSGSQRYIEPAPALSVATRGDDGPIWRSDGHALLFSMMSTLWTLPVTADGQPTGPAVRLNQEVTDAPTWDREGRHILYLNNGTLRLLDSKTKKVSSVETGLTWTREIPHQKLWIQSARLWNGVDAAVKENVDILIVDNRVRAIEPHSTSRTISTGEKAIDAAGLTIIPGMFDMHNHQQMRSKFLGDRQGREWLAYGVTTTRSTGDQVYRALEDRESLDSGARVGPRYFMTGEMFEGSRNEWEFARPVFDEKQLQLDLSRAEALGFDLIKTYVRFRTDWQAKVIAAAHQRMGISVTSHYTIPGAAHGEDGAEHGGGPTRWGFSYSSSNGHLYRDGFETATRTGMELTDTDFSSMANIADDPSMVEDRRIRALYPPWEQADLKDKLLCAQGKGHCGFLPPNPAWSRATVEEFARLLRAGATVMMGTDSPLSSYAIDLQLSMRSMAKYGMTPFEALQTATIIPARAQGVARDLGSVEVGKVADLVFLAADPSVDMRNLAQVKMVMKAGHLYTVEELIQPFKQ